MPTMGIVTSTVGTLKVSTDRRAFLLVWLGIAYLKFDYEGFAYIYIYIFNNNKKCTNFYPFFLFVTLTFSVLQLKVFCKFKILYYFSIKFNIIQWINLWVRHFISISYLILCFTKYCISRGGKVEHKPFLLNLSLDYTKYVIS